MAIRKNKKINIGIFGLGNMGRAIFKLLRKSPAGQKLNFYLCSIGLKKIKGAVILDSLDRLKNHGDIIFLCVKPQEFYNLPPLKSNDKIFISIMAGVKITNIKKIVNSPYVIRVMPNLPLQVGRGVIAWFSNKTKINRRRLDLIKNLFSAFGYSFKVKTEADLNKITAISGSGPAYVFLFIDALIKSAIGLGFAEKQAEEIVLPLLDGSLEYYKSVKSRYTPSQLINKVKSKKGTTAAALNKLNTAKFYEAWRLAVGAAYKRAEQISNYDLK